MAANLAQRRRVWIANGPDNFVPCEVLDMDDKAVSVKTENGQTHSFQLSQIKLYNRNPPAMEGIDDLLQSSNLDEPNILYSLEVRFKKGVVYTATGPIMIAVNPWAVFDIYNPTVVQQYASLATTEGAAPHIFLVASSSYKAMNKTRKNQSILISGESGAGKTESTKYVMQFLATVGGRPGAGNTGIEKQVLESNPVLEAFGNAKTLRNDNSSRFGKYIDINFDDQSMVCGCSIKTYLLERSRVVHQATGERNYHIFYQICSGSGQDAMLQKCMIGPATNFRFLTAGDCIQVASINDVTHLQRTKAAMNFIGLEESRQLGMFTVLGAILHLGNLDFTTDKDDNAKLNPGSSNNVCQLLSVSPEDLQRALCERFIKAGADESYRVPQNKDAASAALVALSKALYAKLFKHLVERLNTRLHVMAPRNTIAVLDIFGFEHFAKNFFEQFCINYANEKLQQHFNLFNFTLEQKEYDKEGIPWSSSDFVDNALCLELIEKTPGGVLKLLDEECIVPQGNDETFLEKLITRAEQMGNPHFQTTKNRRQQFIIVHYAGNVTYTVLGFTEKNKDELQPDLVSLMTSSGNAFIRELFQVSAQEEAAAAAAGGARKTKKALIFDSITSQFKTELAELMAAINKTDPHFVRCVNPNGEKKSGVFDSVNVIKQLRCGGVIEAVRMARERFPCRLKHDQFLFGFSCLAPEAAKRGADAKQRAQALVQELAIPGPQVRMGKTQIFLRQEIIDILEKRRAQLVGKYAVCIQKQCRRFAAARKIAKLRRSRKALQLIQVAAKRALMRAQITQSVQQHRAKIAEQNAAMAKLEEKKRQREAAAREAAGAAPMEAPIIAPPPTAPMADDMYPPPGGGFSREQYLPPQQLAQQHYPPQQPQQQYGTQQYGTQQQQYGTNPTDDSLSKPSPLCIRIQVHAVEGGVTSTYVFHVDKLAASLRNSVTVKDRKSFLKFYPQSFLGSEAIDWLRGHALTCLMDMQPNKDEEKTKRLSRSVALLLGQKLLDVGVFRQVTGSPTKPLEDANALFRFHEDEKEGPLLNCRRIWYQNAREPLLVVSELLRRTLSLDFTNPKLKDSSEMKEITAATAELQLVNINGLSRAQLLAFFLNAFNLMVLHGHVVRGTPDGTNFKSQRLAFMRVVQYMIAAYNYSLEEIEGRLFCRVMRAKYPRKSDQYKAPEPRVHFALSLGAVSSPHIRIYTSQGLERELEEAAFQYCTPIEFNEREREVTLPKVFKWYKEDFGSTKGDVLKYFAKYAPEDIRKSIILMATSNVYKIKYRKFNWNISLEKIRQESQIALSAYNELNPTPLPSAISSPAPRMGGRGAGGFPSLYPGGEPIPNPGAGGADSEYQAFDKVAELPMMRDRDLGNRPAVHVTDAAQLYNSSALLSAEVDAIGPSSGLVQNRMKALAAALPGDDPSEMMMMQAAAPPEANLYGTLSAPAFGPPSHSTPNPMAPSQFDHTFSDEFRPPNRGMQPMAGGADFRMPAASSEFRRPVGGSRGY